MSERDITGNLTVNRIVNSKIITAFNGVVKLGTQNCTLVSVHLPVSAVHCSVTRLYFTKHCFNFSVGSVRRVRGPLVSGTGSTLVLALVTFDHLRSLVTAGG